MQLDVQLQKKSVERERYGCNNMDRKVAPVVDNVLEREGWKQLVPSHTLGFPSFKLSAVCRVYPTRQLLRSSTDHGFCESSASLFTFLFDEVDRPINHILLSYSLTTVPIHVCSVLSFEARTIHVLSSFIGKRRRSRNSKS